MLLVSQSQLTLLIFMLENTCWASLVAQWLRIRLPMQGKWVRALVWEIPHVVEQLSPCATTAEARMPRASAPQQEKPPQ